MSVAPLESAALYRHCDPAQLAQLALETTADLDVRDGLIARDRAIQTVLDLDQPGDPGLSSRDRALIHLSAF